MTSPARVQRAGLVSFEDPEDAVVVLTLDAKPHRIGIAFALALLLGAAYLAFQPGISGPFVFDDIPNIKPLGNRGGVTSLDKLKDFIFHKRAPARALTYASFLLHDYSWPTDPAPFKRFNILLHLLNGVLCFMLARQLTRISGFRDTTADWLALAASALWLLHPLQLSTMMLTIQRLVEVSATFVLVGLIGYIRGRLMLSSYPIRAYVWMSLGLGGGTLLGVLGKGTAVLLPLYAVVVELTLIRPLLGRPEHRWWRGWSTVFFVLPYILLAIILLLRWEESAQIYAQRREFTMVERLMTEPRILFDYLRKILTFRIGGSGIYHDDYPHSTGLLTPLTTLPAILGVVGALGAAIGARYRYPVAAFGVLWFLAGHALESTFLHLELYFEHRNYLPMFGPLFAILIGGGMLVRRVEVRRPVRIAAGALLPLVLVTEAALSRYSATIWGDAESFAAVVAAESPQSIRAQQAAARVAFRNGRPDKALEYLQRAQRHNPEAFGVRLQILYLDCLRDSVSRDEVQGVIRDARHAQFSFAVQDSVRTFIDQIVSGACHTITLEDVDALIESLLANRLYTLKPEHEGNLWKLRARCAKERGLLNPTIHYLQKAFEASGNPYYVIRQAHYLLTAGLPEPALEKLRLAERQLAERDLSGILEPSYPSDVKKLRTQARRMLEEQGESTEEQ